MGISSYSTTPGSNTSISGINIAEGCLPGNINDAIRQMMADIKSDVATQTGTETLTNKTLTSPAINSGVISGGTIDNCTIGGTTPAVGTFSALNSVGDFKVNTTKFVVTASTGDTAVAGSVNATFYGTFGFGVAAGGGFVSNAGTLQAYSSITGGAPQNSGTTDSNQIAQFGAVLGGSTTRLGGYSTGDVWLQVSNNLGYGTNYNLAVNPNGGGLAVGAAFATSQGKLQVKDSTITGANPETSGTTDANQIAALTGGTAQIRMGFFSTGTAWIQASNSADYSTNYSLDFNPNGGAIFFPSVYSDTTAAAANVSIAANGRFQRSTSSRKYKHDITDYTRGLTDVMKLRPVFYKGNNDGTKEFAGLIAEEVSDAGLTEFVFYADDGTPDALAYSNMVALCLKAIQELKTEIDELRGS